MNELISALLEKYMFLQWSGPDQGQVAWEYTTVIGAYELRVTAGNVLFINGTIVTYELPSELYRNIAAKVGEETRITPATIAHLADSIMRL